MLSFDDALALDARGAGAWRAHAAPDREANTGMYGGWTAALLLKAAIAAAEEGREPVALAAHFISRIEPGRDLSVRSRAIGGGRSVARMRAEIAAGDTDEILAFADVAFAARRTNDSFADMTAPAAPDPETLPEFHPPAPFGRSVLVRPAAGFPPYGRPDARSLFFVRDIAARPLDPLLVAYLADCFPPRILYRSAAPRPSSTLTMSIHFFATPEDYAVVGADYVLSEVVATRAEGSTIGSRLDLWSRSGALLATSEQLCWFR